MTTITTRDGDTVDLVAWRHYGRTAGTVEALYRANPWLEHHGVILEAGLTLVLPPAPEPEAGPLVRIWG